MKTATNNRRTSPGTRAALKAWKTRRANSISRRQRRAALKAWSTRKAA